MQNISTQDIIVVAVALVVTWFIGRYLKRKHEREMEEWKEKQVATGSDDKDNYTD